VQNEKETFFSLGKNGVNEYVRTADGRFVLREGDEKLRVLNDDHQGARPERNIAGKTATPEEGGVDSGEAEQEPGWVFSSGSLKEEQTIVPPVDKDRGWDFRILKNGVIEHFRTEDGRVVVRETGDKIQILDQDHDSVALALERAVERFGGYLHFDGNQAGARTLIDIVVTHDLAVTFTDDQLNAQIQLRRTQNGLDRGHSIATSEPAQTPAQKRSADASGSTPERKTAVQPDGQVASQQTGEVFVDCGAAPFNFDEKNDLNYFVRTITPQGEQRFYWGKDLPRALEEAEAKIGESITATRVASKPVTVEEIQEQPDGSRQTVRIDAKRNSWQVDNHGVKMNSTALSQRRESTSKGVIRCLFIPVGVGFGLTRPRRSPGSRASVERVQHGQSTTISFAGVVTRLQSMCSPLRRKARRCQCISKCSRRREFG
jgi:hypothetical protein